MLHSSYNIYNHLNSTTFPSIHAIKKKKDYVSCSLYKGHFTQLCVFIYRQSKINEPQLYLCNSFSLKKIWNFLEYYIIHCDIINNVCIFLFLVPNTELWNPLGCLMFLIMGCFRSYLNLCWEMTRGGPLDSFTSFEEEVSHVRKAKHLIRGWKLLLLFLRLWEGEWD